MAISGIQVGGRVSRLPYVEFHNQGNVYMPFTLAKLSRGLVAVMRPEKINGKSI